MVSDGAAHGLPGFAGTGMRVTARGVRLELRRLSRQAVVAATDVGVVPCKRLKSAHMIGALSKRRAHASGQSNR